MEIRDFTIITPDRTLVNQIWMKHTIQWGGREIWSAEASTLDANRLRRPRNQCPKCDAFFQKKDLFGTVDQEDGDGSREIAAWHFHCPNCQVLLEVQND